MNGNSWNHRLARVYVRPLVGTRVTPNHITTLRLLTGLAASAVLAVGDPTWSIWGGVLWLVSAQLDRADGELARLADKRSPGGHNYDLAADSLCNSVIFLGLGYGLRHGDFGLWATAMGLVAGAAVAAILALTLRLEALEGARAAELGSAAGFDADDAILLVPVLVWLGLSQWLIAAAAIGAPAFALYMVVKFRARLIR